MSYEKICGIYKIENKVNGKIYIGQSVDIKQRLSGHKSALKKNKHKNSYLQNAWNKYGSINFEFKTIELCDVEKLDTREIYWIEFYNSISRDYGYNRDSGGNLKKILSEETKKKISKNHADINGENNPFYGKIHTKETKKKISKNHADFSGEKSSTAKLSWEKVKQIRRLLIETDISKAEIGRMFNISSGNVWKIANNLIWKE